MLPTRELYQLAALAVEKDHTGFIPQLMQQARSFSRVALPEVVGDRIKMLCHSVYPGTEDASPLPPHSEKRFRNSRTEHLAGR